MTASSSEWAKACFKPLYTNSKPYVDIETISLDVDGEPFPVEARLSLWRHSSGMKLIAAFKEMTLVKQAETTLRENERKLTAIFAAVPECIKLVSREGALVEITPAGLTMLEADSLADSSQNLVSGYDGGMVALSL